MVWFTAAITAAAIMGVIAIFDSHLLTKRFPSLRSFILPVGILQLVIGIIFMGIYPLPQGVDTIALVVAFGSGVIRGIGALLMLNTMRSGEISRIIPVVNTFPIFVAILAVPLLGETLGVQDWLGILMTVGGAVLISVRFGARKGEGRLLKSFSVLLGASLLMGIANTGSKYALDYMSSWNMYSVNAICLGTVFLLFSLRPSILRELRDINDRGKALGLLIFNECLVIPGILLYFWAMERGPVSLVSTISSARPAFVFIFVLILSRIFPKVLDERLTRSTIIIKIASIGLVIGGVALITLSG